MAAWYLQPDAQLAVQGARAAEEVRGPRGRSPWAPWASPADSIQDGDSLFGFSVFTFLGYHFVSLPMSQAIGPLVQSLKLCQKANSSPPWGLALNLPGLSVFHGTEEEAISDKVWGVPGAHVPR